MKKELNQISVDIILPNYNSSPYLSETIDSVINQTFKNWKLIIIDDNSNIETKKILKKYENEPNINIIWLPKNKKAGFCRNLGIRSSKSEYVAFIDSDDIWKQDKLYKQLEFMIKKNYNFTYTDYQPFKIIKGKFDEFKIVQSPNYFDFNSFTKNTSIATSSMIIKRSLIGNIKFSNTKICEDYFFKCQIIKRNSQAIRLAENLMWYRVRDDSLQSNKIRNLYWIWYINKNYNKMNFFENLLSLFSISVSSIKRYGFK